MYYIYIIFLLLLIVCFCVLTYKCWRNNHPTETNSPEVYYPQFQGQPSLLEGNVATMATNLQNECVVCLELFDAGQQIRILDCGHYYHLKCVDPWLNIRKNCPKCASTNV